MKERILVVDDEVSLVKLIVRILKREGYPTWGVDSPLKALAWLEEHRADLLVLDIRMPEMDGFTLMGEARRRVPDLGFLVVTAYGEVEMAVEAVNRGADGVLIKPFAKGEFLEALRRALTLHKQKQAAALVPVLRSLVEAGEILFGETHLDTLRPLVVRTLMGLLSGEAAALAEQEAEGPLRVTAQIGAAEVVPLLEDPQGPLARALAAKTVLWMRPEEAGQEAEEALFQRLKVREMISVPVVDGPQKVVLWMAGTQRFNISEVEVLRLLARQGAAALHNARLYQNLRRAVAEVEASRRRMAQAEKLAAMGRLMAMVAHEVNNPLQAVRNSLHLAEHPNLSPEKRHEYLALARRELDRLAETVRRMLDYYRPGSSTRQAVDLSQVVERVVALIAEQARRQGVDVVNEVPPDLPRVWGSAAQLQQVVLNLVVNALDAMPAGGVLTLRGKVQGQDVVIEVEDTGPGIPPEVQERLFEPFVSTKAQGTGLGLAVSYGIVTAHRGTLTYEPRSPHGSCMRITLPGIGARVKGR